MNAAGEQIQDAADRLRAGGLVAFPTETVYGLGADALNADAVRRVFSLKGRPATNPLIVHVLDTEMARAVAREWLRDAETLARAFWPGPLSIVLPRAEHVPSGVTGGGETVAVRSPDHPVARALLKAFGGPIAAPSANPSGSVSATRALHVREAFSDAVQAGDLLVLESGEAPACARGIESTVVTLAEPTPRVLRPGSISVEELSNALGRPVRAHEPDTSDAPGPAPSPGRSERHYAPYATTEIVAPDLLDARIGMLPTDAVVISHRRSPHDVPCRGIALSADAEGYAAGLYGALREADAMLPPLIVVERPPDPPPALWGAIHDRLRRASTPL